MNAKTDGDYPNVQSDRIFFAISCILSGSIDFQLEISMMGSSRNEA